MTDKPFDVLNITTPDKEPEIETMREIHLKFRRDGELTIQLETYLTAKELVELISLMVADDIGISEAMAAWNTRTERTCECGWHGFIDGWGYDQPNYCPNCGARVVS